MLSKNIDKDQKSLMLLLDKNIDKDKEIQLIVVNLEKKHKKCKWELIHMFEEVWVAKLPWAKNVVGCDGKLSMIYYKVCNEIDGREKLLVLRFNNLWKHVGR
jgi:hypothetical protein